jgi:hypothetical protein
VRTAILAAIMLIVPCLAFPVPALAIGPAPTLTLELTPASMDVVSNVTEPLPVVFNGTATVQKGRFDRTTYRLSLISIVDKGWVSTLSTTELTFADSGSQDFNCSVAIPPQTPNVTANLTVDGMLTGGGLSVQATATGRINVEAVAGSHSPAGRIARPGGSDGISPFIVPGIVIAVAAAASLVYLRFFRKRKAS